MAFINNISVTMMAMSFIW